MVVPVSNEGGHARPAVTVSWLTDLIASRVPGPDPVGITRRPVNLLSTSSIIYAVQVDRGPTQRSQQLILKVARTVDERHRREVGFYRHLAARAGPQVPLCYVADADAGYLLMEDCRAGRTAHPMDTTPLAAVGEMVRSLARLHAAFWSLGAEAAVASPVDAGPDARPAMARLVESDWADRLSPGDRRTVARTVACRHEIEAQLTAARTLCHGDFHQLNVLTGAATLPTVTLDWQDAHAGNPAADLALFLAAYLHPRDRRADDWTARYHRELLASGVTGYSMDELRRDVSTGTLLALLAVLRLVRLAGLDPAGALLRLKHVLAAIDEIAVDGGYLPGEG